MRNSRSSLQEHRRPLKTPLLTQAGLNTEFGCLQDKQDHFVEFENKVSTVALFRLLDAYILKVL